MMGLNWFKFDKNKTFKVQKVKQESIAAGAMAAGSLSSAATKLGKILAQQSAPPKILVVGEGTFSTRLIDYAIKMGQKLDFEIVALCILDSPPVTEQDQRQKPECNRQCEFALSRFAEQTAASGVKFSQIIKPGYMEKVIAGAIDDVTGIRYVLSEPDSMVSEEINEHIQVPSLGHN